MFYQTILTYSVQIIHLLFKLYCLIIFEQLLHQEFQD